MNSSLLAPVTPFWIKPKQAPSDLAVDARQRANVPQALNDTPPLEPELAFDGASGETDTVSASLDAADVGLRKAQKTMAALLGKVDAAIKDPARRDTLGSDVELLKDRLRGEIQDAERDGVNWLTLGTGEDVEDKALPSPPTDTENAEDTSQIVLISTRDAADGLLTRPYGASEEQDLGGYHLLSDASSGQDDSREIAVSADVSEDDLKGMRAALASMTADLAKAGTRLDAARTPNAEPTDQPKADDRPLDLGKEIDALLASVTRDALRAQALNIMNGDGSGLKRLLAG